MESELELHLPFLLVFRPKRPSTEEMGSGGSTKKQISPQSRRDARQIYNPPSGKYSASIGNFNYGECLVALWGFYTVVSHVDIIYFMSDNYSRGNK